MALPEALARFKHDPYGHVIWSYPWGQGELRGAEGPNPWQAWILEALRDGLISYQTAIRLAIASGHGIGKSALVAWIAHWAFTTEEGTRGVITANTDTQLKTKTLAEIAKWHRLSLWKDDFRVTASAIFSNNESLAREWRIDVVPWSERNPEAFAGLHNQGKRVLVIYDEASAIPDIIWETTEGALTDDDTEIIWLVCGNPTRNVGRFRQCFDDGQFAHRWRQKKVDSREVPFTNKEEIEGWIEDYGEDSDFVRVRIKGEFPRADSEAFISYDLALQASQREAQTFGEPIVLGCDVARYGDDLSVIYPRQGRDAKSFPVQCYSGISTMQFADYIYQTWHELGASEVFVDGTGVGGGVVDRLMQRNLPVYDVQFGARADGVNTSDRQTKYGNKRAEIWGGLREWLKDGAIIERHPLMKRSFAQELSTPTYTLTAKDAIMLEPKAVMKRRGEPSSDVSDALACTFALPWVDFSEQGKIVRRKPEILPEHNPFTMAAV